MMNSQLYFLYSYIYVYFYNPLSVHTLTHILKLFSNHQLFLLHCDKHLHVFMYVQILLFLQDTFPQKCRCLQNILHMSCVIVFKQRCWSLHHAEIGPQLGIRPVAPWVALAFPASLLLPASASSSSLSQAGLHVLAAWLHVLSPCGQGRGAGPREGALCIDAPSMYVRFCLKVSSNTTLRQNLIGHHLLLSTQQAAL